MQLDKEQILLKEMLEFYSPSLEEGKLADFLVQRMKELGFETKKDEVGNTIGILGKGEKEILLVGHIDTVKGKIPIRVENENLFGRGSVDAKGPMACFISSAARFSEKDLKEYKIIVVGAVCEEASGKNSSKGAKNLLGSFNPNYIVVGEPSGWNAVTLGYKGSFRILLTFEQENFHGAHPGLNSIENIIEVYNAVQGFVNEFNEGKSLFERIETRLEKLHNNSDGLVDKAEMKLRFRLPEKFSSMKLQNFLNGIKGHGKMEVLNDEPAIKVGKANKLVSAFVKAIRSEKGKLKFKVKTGTSDMNILGNYYNCPIVTYGPGNSALDHTPNEHISLEEFSKSINVLEKVLQELIK